MHRASDLPTTIECTNAIGIGSSGATDFSRTRPIQHFFELVFFTVFSILVLWTEEVLGRCPETREGRLPLDPRPLIG